MNASTRAKLSALSLFVGAWLVSGCEDQAFCLDCQEVQSAIDADASLADASSGDTGSLVDAGLDAVIIPDANSAETSTDACNADTQNDPLNCGACGNACLLANAFPSCNEGKCEIESCASGYHDLDQDPANGCEYGCNPSNGGVEACDSKDNDCDGEIDEDFDLQSDVNNCGACGNACDLDHATAKCELVNGTPQCVIDTCHDGFADVDDSDVDGCEYACPVNPPTAEVCNELDDDCDGVINNGDPGGGQPCTDPCPGGVCEGQCQPGVTVCTGTTILCVGGVGPSLELCDNVDNDCNGLVDEGFETDTDPLNCGTCGTVCNLQNAVGGCEQGQCVIATCLPGFNSLDGDPNNGCEYACPVSPPGIEICNGVDDDCDGVVDNPSIIAAQKPASELCKPRPGTPCEGADFVCMGDRGWLCSYGAGVEVDANGSLLLTETRCDGIDGNCNGQVDEVFADLNTECDNGKLGACRDAGKRVCDPNDSSKTICDLSLPPDPISADPQTEICNAIDDDCDGIVDNGLVYDMVEIQTGSLHFFIDRYEASRPDATDTSAGINESRSCTVAGRIPWTQASYSEAAAACAASQRRLCTFAELQAACAGAGGSVYPYGNSFEPATCNGNDYAATPGGGNNTTLLPTGDLAGCVSQHGVYDLSGNAAEWASDIMGNTGAPLNLDIHPLHGGSFRSPQQGLSCGFDLARASSNAIDMAIGFRCCRNP